MSKSILVGLCLLPLVACSPKNATPDVAAVPPASETTPVQRYEPSAPQPSADTDAVSVTEPSDVAFLDQMIPHHQQAIEMAKLAQQRAEHAELKELAADIVSSQGAEIAKMQAWKQDWTTSDTEGDAQASDLGGAHDGGEVGAPDAKDEVAGSYRDPMAPDDDVAGAQGDLTPGAQTTVSQDEPYAEHDDGTHPSHAEVSKDLESLASAEDFDQAFLDAMIAHHQKGIDMARSAEPRLEHAEARELADTVVAGQSEEIARMKEWRQAWFPAAPAPAI